MGLSKNRLAKQPSFAPSVRAPAGTPNDISPLPGTVGYHTVLRSLPTAFLEEWSAKREEARRDRDRLRGQIVSMTQAGRRHECLLTAGQTAGGINEIMSVGEIMRELIAETEAALARAPDFGKRL